ncbi:MAG: cadmium-translocating P-type ATPase [Bacteroidia bacterium]|nr:cadmium-translocating P-type ATPase [Bacteroidia bacterium]
MVEKVHLQVSGMTCANCAQGISRHLEARGVKDVLVSFDSGEVEFENSKDLDIEKVIKEINGLGYKANVAGDSDALPERSWDFSSLELRFLFCALLTSPLLLHMFAEWPILKMAAFQIVLAAPVMWIGLLHFGKSAWGSLKTGSPNMDVLITLGSVSAFIFSCIGWMLHEGSPDLHHHLYFETSSTIITLVLLGNIIEKKSLRKTQSALEQLVRIQPQKARRIEQAMTDAEYTVDVLSQHLRTNDLILVNTGEKIPADGMVYEGTALLDESMMTGESLPVEKSVNDTVLSGTMVIHGHIKVVVQQSGTATVLSKMIDTVRRSALQKPAIQRLGDKVSAWFVPVVIGLSLITFFISYSALDLSAAQSMLRSIAVLVISCPCAMGLATPTAVAVGIGRSARMGILIKGGDTLERISMLNTIVFDKTGTLTKGRISIRHIEYFDDPALIHYLFGTLEQYSSHPFANLLTRQFSNASFSSPIRFTEIKEVPGQGVMATDKGGNTYKIGSARFAGTRTADDSHQVYLNINGEVKAFVDFEDTIREDAAAMVTYFKQKGIQTVLLSGDRASKCQDLARKLAIDEVYAEQMPDQKVEIIKRLQKDGKTAMVGDGINDAAALAVASVGIAVNSGTQIAIQTAEVVLLSRKELSGLMAAHTLAGETMKTIRQNLFWALCYNVVAIPLAAAGFLSPVIASLSMAFSDVVVIGNSLRIHFKRLPFSR